MIGVRARSELPTLGRTLQGGGRRGPAGDRLRHEVEVSGADLLLVLRRGVSIVGECELVLLEAHVRAHPLVGVAARELEHRRVQRVEPRERHELEAVAHRRELLLEPSDLTVVECCFQLKEGEQLYASIVSGCSWRIASANIRASSMSGVDVSHQRRSANGAYARPRAIAASIPPRTRKKPSGVRSPARKPRSRSSTSVVRSAAESASVRAITRVGTSATSSARRAAVSVRTNCSVGASTLPPRCPHFFSDASWSSKCTPAAPASIIAVISSNAFRVPPNPASASATIGTSQSRSAPPPVHAIWSARRSALLIRRTTAGTELAGYRD